MEEAAIMGPVNPESRDQQVERHRNPRKVPGKFAPKKERGSKAMADTSISQDAEKIREQFRDFLAKANKENPRVSDVTALSDFLHNHKGMELWKAAMGMGALAEHTALNNLVGNRNRGTRQCWELRLQSLRADLGFESASALERLLIQQVTLCWLNLNLVECRHSNLMHESIALTLGIYWEKRLTAAQRRFMRACESLARVRKLSRNTPALQFNIATKGGQQVNLAR